MPPELDIEEKLVEFNTSVTQLGKAIEQRDKEVKDFGKATEETGKAVDTLGESVEGIKTEFTDHSIKMKERLEELEKTVKRPDFTAPSHLNNAGKDFVESEQFKAMVGNGSSLSGQVSVKNLINNLMSLKTLSGAAGSAGALVVPMRLPDVIIPPQRPATLRDLITVSPASSSSIDYIEQTGYAPLYATLAAIALAGANTLVFNLGEFNSGNAGFFSGQKFSLNNVVYTVDTVSTDGVTITITGYGLQTQAEIDDEAVANVFAPTAETKVKPISNITYLKKTIAAKVVASWLPVSKQILKDAPQLSSLINTQLAYGLMLSEEFQILWGDGAGENLSGIMTNANRQTYSWSAGTVGDTKLDAIRRAMTLARLAEYPVNGILLHPNDWEDIELLKGTNGQYIWINVNDGGVPRLFKVPTTDSTVMLDGRFLLGAFALGATLYDYEETTIEVAEQHASYFIENMLAIRAEERIALGVHRPEAFVDGTFDNAPV